MDPELKAEIDKLVSETGDAIANMFAQLVKGNWRDDHGHDVQQNTAMLALQPVLLNLMAFRSKHLDYSDVSEEGLTKL